MNRYLLSEPTAAEGATTRVPIDSRVGIYRRGDGSKTIVAETDDEQIDLGVRDATVSRKTNGYVASDLEIIASTAARNALKEARDADSVVPISQAHLTAAIEDTDPSLDAWDG